MNPKNQLIDNTGIKLKDNKGSALVIVVLTASLFVILAAGMSVLTYSSYRYNINESKRSEAFYIAEACFEETRTRVTVRLQSFINQGDFSQNSFEYFLSELPGIVDEVSRNDLIKSLGASSITGSCQLGNNSSIFTWNVIVDGFKQELKAQFLFDAPESFSESNRATDKMEVLWGVG